MLVHLAYRDQPESTPADRYLRDLHNNFHGGLAVSFHDCSTGVGEVEQALLTARRFRLQFHLLHCHA